jgi:predicted dehydrogenase
MTVAPQESLKLELENFIQAIQTNSLGLVTLDQGIQALKVIEASYLAFKTGKVVNL